MHISERNLKLYTSETDADFENRLRRETEGMTPPLAQHHRTQQKARRTRARNIVAARQQTKLPSPWWLQWG